jgi:hypothetical protein
MLTVKAKPVVEPLNDAVRDVKAKRGVGLLLFVPTAPKHLH